MQDFFSSCFHHFHFGVSQSATPLENAGEETEIQLLVRMAFVARSKDFDALAQHWKRSLSRYADRLTIFVGPHVDATLRNAIESVSSSLRVKNMPQGKEAFEKGQQSPAPELALIAHYYISKVGHDRGTYRLVIHPPITPTNVDGRQEKGRWHGLKVGDTLDSLLLIPLHVLRPSLHEMNLGPDGGSRLENAYFDDDANVLFVLVKTVLTEAHLRHLHGGANNTTSHGFVVCEFPFRFGWAALKDMPHDANSNRILPQPVIRVGLRVETTVPEGVANTVSMGSHNASWTERCTPSRCALFASMRIDHQTSLERLMDSLVRNQSRSETGPSCFCYYWIRCSNVAGTTIPVPDPAMVFNVVSLGLIFSAVLSAGVTRITRFFFDRD
ncbi:glycosylphosphatidylinositol (GPI) anchor [Trypanosoma rangeli SC58]|uniref:Glycosylphosphatidylinositol (GPI) anchor n=1 Tax=Trypanosoma rangeli SC58 TaxID=429131 RepID=A0A061J4G3_TRYRA|nr:glycosylphosphatidylinositol (GPI) anchor [Trypanosoma rangeli SC58]